MGKSERSFHSEARGRGLASIIVILIIITNITIIMIIIIMIIIITNTTIIMICNGASSEGEQVRTSFLFVNL